MDILTKRSKIEHIADKLDQIKSLYGITKELDGLKQLIKEYDLDEVEFIEKGFSGTEKGFEVNEEERSVVKYVSTISVDRDGDIIIPEGGVFDDFNKHKVILYAHRHGADMFGGGEAVLPIGKDMWIKKDKFGVKAKQVYHDVTELARNIFDMHVKGFPLASSIGFIPLEIVYNDGGKEWKETAKYVKDEYGLKTKDINSAKSIIKKWYLLEHSDVPVGSNPDTLMAAFKAGEVKFKSAQLLQDLELEKQKEAFTIKELEESLVIECEKTEELEKTIELLEKDNDAFEKLATDGANIVITQEKTISELEATIKEKDAEIKRIKAEKPKFTKEQAKKLIDSKMIEVLNHIDKLMGKV